MFRIISYAAIMQKLFQKPLPKYTKYLDTSVKPSRGNGTP